MFLFLIFISRVRSDGSVWIVNHRVAIPLKIRFLSYDFEIVLRNTDTNHCILILIDNTISFILTPRYRYFPNDLNEITTISFPLGFVESDFCTKVGVGN